jgi:hypothetical protein
MTTKVVDVLNIVAKFVDENNIPMDKLVSICTDGAPAMLGNKSGFLCVGKKVGTTCNRYSLHATWPCSCFQKSATIFEGHYENCILAVNCQFHSQPTTESQTIPGFCKEMGEEHEVLLFHSEVRWLSRNSIYELRKEIELLP